MSVNEMVIRIGGEGGEGVISTGELLALTMARCSLNVFTFRTYPAEVKGGHAWYQLRLSEEEILAQGDRVDVLVAFNQDAFNQHIGLLGPAGVLVYDSSDFQPDQRIGNRTAYGVPFTELAKKQVGKLITKNIVIISAISELFGAPRNVLEGLIRDRFEKKGASILEMNTKAFEVGVQYIRENVMKRDPYEVKPLDRPRKMILSGHQAIALGCLIGGCRYFAGYPITPASDILEWIAAELPKVGGLVVQTEDEMAALSSVIGAAFAGQRAMTATSGPGLSLMSELIGLASMAELPVVIVDSQRAGPATGMPTKTEQSDLNFAIYGTHGDTPRIVIAPTGVRECFKQAIRAFNLAERYSMPVIVLTDQSLAQRTETFEKPDSAKIELYLRQPFNGKETEVFHRYDLDHPLGNPRPVPGDPGGIHVVGGLEHGEDGSPRYDPETHRTMMQRRFEKLARAADEIGSVATFGDEQAKVGVVGWGSSVGAVREAVALFESEEVPVRGMETSTISPLPVAAIQRFAEPLEHLIVVEANFTGQFANWIRANTGLDPIKLTKCEGIPISTQEVMAKVKEVMGNE